MDERVEQVAKKPWDPLEFAEGPITRGRSKRLKEALEGIMLSYHQVSLSLECMRIKDIFSMVKAKGKECMRMQRQRTQR